MVDLATRRRVQIASDGSRGDVLYATSDGRLLLSQSHQVDVLYASLLPSVIATNPPAEAIVALPLSTISVVFSLDMLDDDSAVSVTNSDNYRLFALSSLDAEIDADTPRVEILGIEYDQPSRTAYLTVDAMPAGLMALHVLKEIESRDATPLAEDYQMRFVAASDFTALVDLDFTLTRSARVAETVTYEVQVTNVSPYDLQLPMFLTLDPGYGYPGVPQQHDGLFPDGRYYIDLRENLPTGGVLTRNASTTGRTIRIDNPDQLRVDYQTTLHSLPTDNLAPTFRTEPLRAATVGQTYFYNALAVDPDWQSANAEDPPVVAYVLLQGPDGMTVDLQSGAVRWQPTVAAPVETAVTLGAVDVRGGRGVQSFTISVVGGNHAPQFTGDLPDSVDGLEGQPLTVTAVATDADGDNLLYWVENLPPGAVFDHHKAILDWTPSYEQAGIYRDIAFYVSDGKAVERVHLDLIIAPTNQAPVLEPPNDLTVREGDRLRFYLQAHDPDDEPVVFSSDDLPEGATLHANSGLFDWIVPYHQTAGEVTTHTQITFTASAGDHNDSAAATFEVLNANAAPRFVDFRSVGVAEGQNVEFVVTAIDPDHPDDSLTVLDYSATNLPPGAEFDADTATFKWTPGYADAGDYYPQFTVVENDNGDNTGAPETATVQVPIHVVNVNQVPVIAPITNTSAQRGAVIELDVSASDGDGNPLVLTAHSGYLGYTLPDFVSFQDHGDGTGTFTLAPDAGHRGDHPLVLTATDDGDGAGSDHAASDSFEFVVTVQAENEPPRLTYVGDLVSLAGVEYELKIHADDQDQESLAFTQSGLPEDEVTIVQQGGYGDAVLKWTPSATSDRNVELTVTDGGNNGTTAAESHTISFRWVVRTENAAPTMEHFSHQTVAEGQTLTVLPVGSDTDGDALTWSATGLPPRASIDPVTGQLDWTPNFDQAGSYQIIFSASDGLDTVSQALNVEVVDTNRAPRLVPVPDKYAEENRLLQFTVTGADLDGDDTVYAFVGDLPETAQFNTSTGQFRWTPTYEDAGDHQFPFRITDTQGASHETIVNVRVGNVNRPPQVVLSHHAVQLGAPFQFQIAAVDPDGESLTFDADHLPFGATVDAATGVFRWTPGPAQAGEHVVTFHVTDAVATTSRAVLLKAAVEPELPDVQIVLTPSFPVAPGATVLVQVIASSLAEIENVQFQVDGQTVVLDQDGRAEITASRAGKIPLLAQATDKDGLVGTTTMTLMAHDPVDTSPPLVNLDSSLFYATIDEAIDIVGSVADENLDGWALEMAPINSDNFQLLSSGEMTIERSSLGHIDPQQVLDGFYVLRLSATDFDGRLSYVETTLEIHSAEGPQSYVRDETDLSISIGGIPVELARSYDSLARNFGDAFGDGWQWTNRETNLQTNVPPTGREDLGIYSAFHNQTKLFLTLPDGHRAGFSFTPLHHQIPGFDFYEPAWTADAGVDWTLASAPTLLQKAGYHFYELSTGLPYNPAHPQLPDAHYTLTAPGGRSLTLDGQGRVVRVVHNGDRVVVADSGMVSPNGDALEFRYNGGGRLNRVTLAPVASDQDRTDLLEYGYDKQDRLVAVRNMTTGLSTQYGYAAPPDERLTLVAHGDGTGVVIEYGETVTEVELDQFLGTVGTLTGQSYAGTLGTSETARYAFAVRDDELDSTYLGKVLMRVTVTAQSGPLPAEPQLSGTAALSSEIRDSVMTSLFAIEHGSVYLLQFDAADNQTTFSLDVTVAGDIDLDGDVDGHDSDLFNAAFGKPFGSGGYVAAADFDGNRSLDGNDRLILAHNYGFTAIPAEFVGVTATSEIVSLSWHNAVMPTDVNYDGRVGPLDALLVVNDLNSHGAGPLDEQGESSRRRDYLLDVNNDYNVSPVDALIVINQLNAVAETGPASSDPYPPDDAADAGGDFESGAFNIAAMASAVPQQDFPLGVINGSFSSDQFASDGLGWVARGEASIVDGQLHLGEGGRFFTGATQAFEIPTTAEQLLFTIVSVDLHRDENQPADAFEVALLSVSDGVPLLGGFNGLDSSDALLNIQADGQTFFAAGVTIAGFDQSGDFFSWSNPTTVAIDLAAFSENQIASLHFDLLGFGLDTSQVAVDNVRLVGLEPPETQPDEAATLEDETVEIEVLANDYVPDGDIAIDSLTLLNGPSHGTATVDISRSSIIYQPDENYSGQDQFTYTVQSTAGISSDATVVSIDIEPVADPPEVVVAPNAGAQDTIIRLPVAAALIDADGSETLSMDVSNLPDGATLLHRAPDEMTGAVDLAKRDLAGRLGIAIDDLTLLSVTEKEFTDSCLEAGALAEACTQIVSSGHSILLEHWGVEYEYRTPALETDLLRLVDYQGRSRLLEAPFWTHIQPNNIPPDQLDGLGVLPPAGYTQNFNLFITGAATEQANGDRAETSIALPILVNKVQAGTVEVEEVTVNNGEDQRSSIHTLAIRFNQDVLFADLLSDVTVAPAVSGVSPAENEAFELSGDRYTYDPETFTLTIDLRGTYSEDNHFQMLLNARGIRSRVAQDYQLADTDIVPSDGVDTYQFHQLMADFNGNDRVDEADYDLFQNFFPSQEGDGRYYWVYDLNHDGRIDLYDYNIWRRRQDLTSDQLGPAIVADLQSDTGRSDRDGITRNAAIRGAIDEASEITSLRVFLDDHEPVEIVDRLQRGPRSSTFNLTQEELGALNSSSMEDGPHTLRFEAVDVHGNISTTLVTKPALTFELDSLPPQPPTKPDLRPIRDSGHSDEDDVTRFRNLLLQTVAEDSALVSLMADGHKIGAAVASSPLSFNTPTMVDGWHEFAAVAEDVAGNISAMSDILSVLVDTVAPVQPYLHLAEAADTAPTGDGRTELDIVSLTGYTDPELSVRVVETGTTIAADAAGVIELDDVYLALGRNIFTTVATDDAGNTSGATQIITRIGPEIDPPVIDAWLVHDTGRDVADGVTNDPTIHGTLEDEHQVDVFRAALDDGPLVDVLDSVHNGEFVLDEEALEQIAGGDLKDGAHRLTLYAEDEYANAVDALFSLSFELDRAAPRPPATPDLSPDDDHGPSSSDNKTNETSPTIQVSAEKDSLVRIAVDGNQQAPLVSHTGTVATTSGPFDDGTHTISATAEDIAGNVSGTSDVLIIDIDTAPPQYPTLGLHPDFDSPPPGDDITSFEEVTLTGTTEEDTVVHLLRGGDPPTTVASTTSDGQGNFQFESVMLAQNANALRVVAEDWAGNTSSSDKTITSIAPDTSPPLIEATLANDTGRSNQDSITNDSSIEGTVDDALAITVFKAGLNAAPSVNVLEKLHGGKFTFAKDDLTDILGYDLKDGSHTLRLLAEDALGHASETYELAFQLDTKRPFPPSQPDLLAPSDSGTSQNDNITGADTLTIQTDAETDGLVTLFVEGIVAGQQVATSPSQFVVMPTEDGELRITATVEDVAGNVSVFAPPLLVTYDTQAPVIDSFGLDDISDTRPFGDNATNLRYARLAGLTESTVHDSRQQIQVELLETGQKSVADRNGAFGFRGVELLGLGDHGFTLRATDTAGNSGTTTASVTKTAEVSDDLIRPAVMLEVSATSVEVGETVVFTVTATDDVGVVATSLTVNGQAVPLDENGRATYTSTVHGILAAEARRRCGRQRRPGPPGSEIPAPRQCRCDAARGDFPQSGTYPRDEHAWRPVRHRIRREPDAVHVGVFGKGRRRICVPVREQHERGRRRARSVRSHAFGERLLRCSADGRGHQRQRVFDDDGGQGRWAGQDRQLQHLV